MAEETITIQMFCACCQKVTTHEGDIDGNGEYVFTCKDNTEANPDNPPVLCGHFVKFPANVTPDQFPDLAKKHEDHNKGQISIAEQREKLKKLANSMNPKDKEANAPVK